MKTPRSFLLAGFSLLELLIVIASISILVGLLLPVMANLRERSSEAQCVTQLRQVGVAFSVYAADNGNLMPRMVYGNNHAKKGQPIPATWGYAAMPFTSRLLGAPYDMSAQAKNTLKDPRLLFCPAARRPDGTRLRLPAAPAILGSATIPYIGYNFIYLDSSVGYAANLYKDFDNVRVGASTRNPVLLWCFTPKMFAAAGKAHRSHSNVLYINGSVRVISHAQLDDEGPGTSSDFAIRLMENASR